MKECHTKCGMTLGFFYWLLQSCLQSGLLYLQKLCRLLFPLVNGAVYLLHRAAGVTPVYKVKPTTREADGSLTPDTRTALTEEQNRRYQDNPDILTS